MVSAKIVVKGTVQMVGFRYYTIRQAQTLGIYGYVRNLPNGNVEVVAQTDSQKMHEFISLIKQGPSSARVEDMTVEYDTNINETFLDFSVRY